MGRHSAPDDEEDAVAARVSAPPRHAVERRPEPRPRPVTSGLPTAPPAETPPAGTARPDAATAPPAETPPAGAARPDARQHSTAGDLALVRAHGDVRARCLAGLLVPFVLYAAVMLAIGASGTRWAVWIFAPLVLAGVLVGGFLDAGHRRYPPIS